MPETILRTKLGPGTILRTELFPGTILRTELGPGTILRTEQGLDQSMIGANGQQKTEHPHGPIYEELTQWCES